MPSPARLLATTALALTFATSATPALALLPVSPGTAATTATTATAVPADPADPSAPRAGRDNLPAGAPGRDAALAGSALGGTGDLGIGWDDWI